MAQGEKTEQPTERKRRRVREEGQVARSFDLGAAVVLGVAVLVFKLAGHSMAGGCMRGFERALHDMSKSARTDVTLEVVHAQYAAWLATAVKVLLPLPLAIMASGMIVAAAQVGVAFQAKALSPRWDRLNPVTGVKRLFSRRALVESIKGIAKVTLFVGVIYVALRDEAAALCGLACMEPVAGVQLIADLALKAAVRVGAAMLLLGAADYGYQRWEFERELRMTRQELKEEVKQTEGDPHARGRFRRARERFVHAGITDEMREATTVVTNPTRIAVALKYDDGRDEAPRVVAKGQYKIAEEIVRLAGMYDIPVIPNVEVARALYKQAELGREIPGNLYRAVAEILVVVYRLRERKRRAHRRSARRGPEQQVEQRAPESGP